MSCEDIEPEEFEMDARFFEAIQQTRLTDAQWLLVKASVIFTLNETQDPQLREELLALLKLL